MQSGRTILFALLIILNGLTFGFNGGDGTPQNPYRIAAPAHLVNVNNDVTAHYRLVNDIDLGDEVFSHSPISPDTNPSVSTYYGTPFIGSFNGNGFVIRNLTINAPTYRYLGLFGTIGSGGRVFDLGVENVDITGRDRVGGLVGYAVLADISGCYTTGVVSGNIGVGGFAGQMVRGAVVDARSTAQVSGHEIVGGLIGYSERDVYVDNCRAAGDVFAAYQTAGGLIGQNDYGRAVVNSSATGRVEAAVRRAGGLIGISSSVRIVNCHAKGKVFGGQSAAGLVGECIRGMINASYATGDVWATADGVGGLVGWARDADIQASYATGQVVGVYGVGGLIGISIDGDVRDSYATGGVSATGVDFAGGLVGRKSNGVIEKCYATGTVSASDARYVGGLVGHASLCDIIRCYSTGSVSGQQDIGGLAGFLSGNVHRRRPEIVNSYATGSVTAAVAAGGLAGRVRYAVVQNSYAAGSVSGGSDIGGLVGVLSDEGRIEYCYSVGAVSGTDAVGGLVGSSSGSSVGSFWDSETSGTSPGAEGAGRTTAQMQDPLTFTAAGWSREQGWSFPVGRYPFLTGLRIVGDIDQDGVVGLSDFAVLSGQWLKNSLADIDGIPGHSIINPYEGINWSAFGQYKAALHNHTIMSDGSHSVAGLIDQYHSMGFDILAITDHDNCCPYKNWINDCPDPTWPWTDYGRNPDQLGMVAIMGNEVSRGHHIVSLFNDYGDGAQTSTEAAIVEIGNRGGLAFMAHPIWSNHVGGRGLPAGMEWTPEVYAYFFAEYDHLLGMEIRNWEGRLHEKLWDDVLTLLMPEHFVWGFNVDDTHSAGVVAHEWTTFILPTLSSSAVRQAMINGHFFFSDTQRPNGKAPVINAIHVDHAAGTITIDADDSIEIMWISRGREVQTGPTFTLGGIQADGYVRARLYGPQGVSYTQPFGIFNPCAFIFEQGLAYPSDLTMDCRVGFDDLILLTERWLSQ